MNASQLLRTAVLTLAPIVAPPGKLSAEHPHNRHVVFETCHSDGGYYHSSASSVAPSTLEAIDGKLPVEGARSVSPPNCLRLEWLSAPGGGWHAQIKSVTRYGQSFRLQGDALEFWCYSEEGLTADDAPRIAVASRGGSLPAIPMLRTHGDLPAGKWVRLRLPFAGFTGPFRGTGDSQFDPAQLNTIHLMQGLDDGQRHVLLIDDVRVVPTDEAAPATPPPPPTDLTVEGQDSHFDLAWDYPPGAAALSFRLYRSWDGKDFAPIDTRPGYFRRCVDYVGRDDKTAHYRVTAVDLHGNESQPSEGTHASTREYDDNELMTMAQRSCFRYYWEAAHPNAGMALEILPGDENLVALGASGFGVMALIVGAERGFAPREEAAQRVLRIVRFLEQADRFHGVWPHFLDGRTGRVIPFFGKYDNGGDLVETAFMIQALLTARQYFDDDTPEEEEIRATVTRLWHEVEWDWYRKSPDSGVLYWHWSPDHHWHVSHPLIGWNETMIVYLLAIASPTHGVPAELFHTGFAGQSEQAVEYRQNWSRTTDGDHYTNGNTYYGIPVEVGCGNGGELFFNQFSFLGFDPRGKRDRYTNYFRNNRNIALVSRAYAIDNPLNRVGYGPDCWGRSAGIHSGGGRAQPRDDNGTISSSASLGLFPYTPAESMAALKHFYRQLGDRVWGVYGFHDGFNQTERWFDEVYMGLNQAQITVGIENHRSGLLWKHFMANPEIEPMLERIGFRPDEDPPVGGGYSGKAE